MGTATEVQMKQFEAMRRMVPQWIATVEAIAAMNAQFAKRWGDLISPQETTGPE